MRNGGIENESENENVEEWKNRGREEVMGRDKQRKRIHYKWRETHTDVHRVTNFSGSERERVRKRKDGKGDK